METKKKRKQKKETKIQITRQKKVDKHSLSVSCHLAAKLLPTIT
jgi:hypothetical protein